MPDTGVDVDSMTLVTELTDAVGFFDSSSAARPETTGAADDVPPNE